MRTLKRPGIPVGPPQLSLEKDSRGRYSAEELLQSGHPEFALGIEGGQGVAYAGDVLESRMVVGSDEHRDVRVRRPGY